MSQYYTPQHQSQYPGQQHYGQTHHGQQYLGDSRRGGANLVQSEWVDDHHPGHHNQQRPTGGYAQRPSNNYQQRPSNSYNHGVSNYERSTPQQYPYGQDQVTQSNFRVDRSIPVRVGNSNSSAYIVRTNHFENHSEVYGLADHDRTKKDSWQSNHNTTKTEFCNLI